MTTIADRFTALIEANVAKATRFKTLEEMSGIPAVSWRKAFLKGQRPTAEMIEVLATEWAECAFWLVTGITDSAHGHIGPNVAYETEINLREKPDQISCIHYIRQKSTINRQLSKEDRTELKKEELDEIYNFRCARDTERLGYLTRQTAHRKSEVVGYFEPRMLKYLDPSDGSEN